MHNGEAEAAERVIVGLAVAPKLPAEKARRRASVEVCVRYASILTFACEMVIDM